MLDVVTLRVAFGLVAVGVLVLFYGVTYRSTRSSYSGWWCASLACFIVSASLFLFNGTAVQVIANPLGNTSGVLGAACVWAGARTLREREVRWWQLAILPTVVLAASLLDDPRDDVWSGGAAYLFGMAVLIGGSAAELVRLLRTQRPAGGAREQFRFAVTSMAIVSGVLGGYYLTRDVVFVVTGPDGTLFRMFFGGQVTTLLTMLLLVVVTFSMSALSHEQQTTELRRQATRDGLTGLLNRRAFLEAAERQLDHARVTRHAAVLVADLDRFKSINDGSGHAAGDRALVAFADACRSVVGQQGIVSRLGGDEFGLLTLGRPAEDIVAEIAERYSAGAGESDPPTASFGIAAVLPHDDVGLALARADEALYAAKDGGRARAVRHDDRREHRRGRGIDGRRTA